jgi:hypothetical protein
VLFCVFCLIVVPLPPGTKPFAVKINNNNNNNNNICSQCRSHDRRIGQQKLEDPSLIKRNGFLVENNTLGNEVPEDAGCVLHISTHTFGKHAELLRSLR